MEGRMPSTVENVGADESQGGTVGSEVEVRNERQLTDKLEKSEAGRKKLRQAIALLKEKLDVTSNVLEVNETLRREVEKERLNVDAERNRVEAERVLREQVEKENLTLKEQFTGVLQRLDFLESSFQRDRGEFGRICSEVKEAVGCVRSALQVVEATKSLYESLERSVHAKINGAVQSSSKALVIAQSGQATMSRALGAQSVAKAVQKEVQLLSSQVATLQMQASNLSAVGASMQQDTQLRSLGTPDSGEANVSLAVSMEKVSSLPRCSAVPPLCKNQTVVQESSQAKIVSGEGDLLNMLVASSEKPRSNPAGSTIGLPPLGGMILSRNQILDEVLKPQTTISQSRPGYRSPSKGSLEVVSKDEPTPNGYSSQPVSSSVKKGPVATIIALDTILSPSVKSPALLDNCTKSSPSARSNALKQSGEQPQRFPDISKGLESGDLSNKRRVVKRGQGDPTRKLNPSTSAQNENCTTHVEADVAFSDGMLLPDGEPYPSSTTMLMKSIMKMFEREGKHRRNMEEKLMKLQGALESPVQAAQTGLKRKREPRKGKGIGGSEKGKKRHPVGGKSKMSDVGLSDAVTSHNQRSCLTEDKCILQEKEVQQKDTQGSEDAQDRLSKMISNLQGRCRGEGLFEATVECQEIAHVRGTDECKDSYDVDICNDDLSKEGTGTNTDVEGTDDDLGEDWWAKRVLLSPISSYDRTS